MSVLYCTSKKDFESIRICRKQPSHIRIRTWSGLRRFPRDFDLLVIFAQSFTVFRYHLELEVSWANDDSNFEVRQAVLMPELIPLMIFQSPTFVIEFRFNSTDLFNPTSSHTLRETACLHSGLDDLRWPTIVLFTNRYLHFEWH